MDYITISTENESKWPLLPAMKLSRNITPFEFANSKGDYNYYQNISLAEYYEPLSGMTRFGTTFSIR